MTPNLYGNLVANTAAGIAGGTGVMPGGNVVKRSYFELSATYIHLLLENRSLMKLFHGYLGINWNSKFLNLIFARNITLKWESVNQHFA